jgi:hypothetical protein
LLGEEKSLKIKFCIEDMDPEVQQLEKELRELEKVT